MKTLFNIIGIAVLLSVSAFAQLTTTSTTLSSAIVANTTTQWCIASSTGVSATSISAAGTYLFVDKEAAQVTSAGSSTTCWNVKRGQLGTSASYAHANAATVWVGNVATGTGDTSRPFSGGVLTANVPSGTCTASAQYSLPVIIVAGTNSPLAGALARCISGIWQIGTSQPNVQPYTAFPTLSDATVGATTTQVAGTIWFSQLFIPANATLTGACVLNGATVGTDKYIVALYDAAGNVLANSATAGTTTASASLYQCIAFASTVSVTGPASYFAAIQTNGTTDNFFTYKTGGAPLKYGTQSQTGVFGTVAAMTTPTTTFTTAKGPLMIVY